jgi:hypothetical protein
MDTQQIQESLQAMYELGVEHGRQLAEQDMRIKQLVKKVEELVNE